MKVVFPTPFKNDKTNTEDIMLTSFDEDVATSILDIKASLRTSQMSEMVIKLCDKINDEKNHGTIFLNSIERTTIALINPLHSEGTRQCVLDLLFERCNGFFSKELNISLEDQKDIIKRCALTALYWKVIGFIEQGVISLTAEQRVALELIDPGKSPKQKVELFDGFIQKYPKLKEEATLSL